jgi:hypothetical protein
MEHTLIGAYVGLLLGYLIMENKVKLHCCNCMLQLRSSSFDSRKIIVSTGVI